MSLKLNRGMDEWSRTFTDPERTAMGCSDSEKEKKKREWKSIVEAS